MRKIRMFALAIALSLTAVLATAVPASAHDELVASTPSYGEALDVAPTTIALTFSDDVLAMGAVVVVADESGTDWAVTDAELDGSIVTVQVAEDMPEAGYEVRWRVVSSDGHPISGIVPFTIGDAEPFVRDTVTDTDGASAADTSEEGAAAQPGDTAAPNADATTDQITETTNDPLRVVVIGAIGAALAAGAFALFLFLRRRSSAEASEGDSTPSENS